MKKSIKYIIGAIGFFLTMTLLDYLFQFETDILINLATTVVYLLFNVLSDYIFKK